VTGSYRHVDAFASVIVAAYAGVFASANATVTITVAPQ